ncbi:hypothetical protein BDZ45DRAFT_672081 [Acephala macrosclerotiorum]|nr:hypothetical protein BDZ45DRAFT_672081 [Acephala macrosclerotiorum]
MDLAWDCDPDLKSMELHEYYPDELVRRFQFTEDEIPEGTNRVERWIQSNARVVWGWRREYYPAFVAKVSSAPSLQKVHGRI